jgi:DNA-binding Lrp family transcriptional regulator
MIIVFRRDIVNLKQIKIECLNRNITMTELAKKLNISRVWLYNRIQKQDEETLIKIKNIFDSAVIK